MSPTTANALTVLCALLVFLVAPALAIMAGGLDDKHQRRTLNLVWACLILGIVGAQGIHWHMTGISPWEHYKGVLPILAGFVLFIYVLSWAAGKEKL